ncbi:hypothetical protein PR048_032433 [Dryococelus australis]|uniref:Uncharacterized protein n=1 Tax=Dryococelus australis TaxID=614101 RepID=A0ABQ9G260_9NEOP|nr:hypothetical protein PR048_032433 [Dryococelus australis]
MTNRMQALRHHMQAGRRMSDPVETSPVEDVYSQARPGDEEANPEHKWPLTNGVLQAIDRRILKLNEHTVDNSPCIPLTREHAPDSQCSTIQSGIEPTTHSLSPTSPMRRRRMIRYLSFLRVLPNFSSECDEIVTRAWFFDATSQRREIKSCRATLSKVLQSRRTTEHGTDGRCPLRNAEEKEIGGGGGWRVTKRRVRVGTAKGDRAAFKREQSSDFFFPHTPRDLIAKGRAIWRAIEGCFAGGAFNSKFRGDGRLDFNGPLNKPTRCRRRRRVWSNVGMKGRGKREIPENTRRPTASSGTIPTCENPVTRPGIELCSPWWEARVAGTPSKLDISLASRCTQMMTAAPADLTGCEKQSCRLQALIGFEREPPPFRHTRCSKFALPIAMPCFSMSDARRIHGAWPPDAPTSISMPQHSLHVNPTASLALMSSAYQPMRVFAVNMEWRRNEGAGETGDPRKKPRLSTASSGMIPTCENPVTQPGIDPGSPWWEASVQC